MRKEKIVYTHPEKKGSLYVKLTPGYACTNRCAFCVENRKALERLVGAGPRLKSAPDAETVLRDLRTEVSPETKEIVFCGVGEPTLYLDTLLEITHAIKKEFGVRVRVDTNGQGELIHKCSVVAKKLRKAGVDAVYVSLNALTPRQYEKVCRPVFGEKAFWAVLRFIRRCNREGLETKVSFVEGYPGLKINKTTAIALARVLGVRKENVLFRKLVS